MLLQALQVQPVQPVQLVGELGLALPQPVFR
jgi:hypothetical protein